ncbi:MAG: phospholipid carrier-dependent glycosyltransferase [Steroidobacteraceae bacterium]
MDARRIARAGRLLALLSCVGLAVLGLGHGLWTPDEPREAEISREMLLAPGVIPTLNGVPFVEKPPLYYWVVAGVYRALGQPSANAARAVSAAAGLLSLWCLYAWAARAGRRRAGLVAAVMLASSVQFTVSTHWVLIDPLLMLFTTLASWAAWERLRGAAGAPGQRGWLALLYVALTLALWTKGLIGVVLPVAGIMVAVVMERLAWRRLRPFSGALFLAAMVVLLGVAIWRDGGRAALWEWAWVNHVQRFTNPGATGHRQPLLYYLWTLPWAILPWLVPLLDGLRPAAWRAATPEAALQRHGAWSALGMLLLLSAAATKRETYLLPLLPPLVLWLGLRVDAWFGQWSAATGAPPGWRWWLQYALLALYALAPPVALMAYRRGPDATALVLLALAAGVALLAAHGALRGRRLRAGRAALGCAWMGTAALLLLLPRAVDATKDMAPFVRWMGQQLPADGTVYALNVDETLSGIVPFETGRRLVAYDPAAGGTPPPEWLLDQEVNKGARTRPPAGYVLVRRERFGPGRALALWRREAALSRAAPPATAP